MPGVGQVELLETGLKIGGLLPGMWAKQSVTTTATPQMVSAPWTQASLQVSSQWERSGVSGQFLLPLGPSHAFPQTQNTRNLPSMWKSKFWYWIEFLSGNLDLFSIDLSQNRKRNINYSRPALETNFDISSNGGLHLPWEPLQSSVSLCWSSLRCSHFVPLSSLLDKKTTFRISYIVEKKNTSSSLNAQV